MMFPPVLPALRRACSLMTRDCPFRLNAEEGDPVLDRQGLPSRLLLHVE
jgi:hypothetical protein